MTKSIEGLLAPVVRFKHLQTRVSDPEIQKCFLLVREVVENLGRAAQMGQHRALIEVLDRSLTHETLETIAYASILDRELCSAFSVYFTTLEQSYAWPREGVVSTPINLHNHKLVVQMIYHEELSIILFESILEGNFDDQVCCEAGCLALREAELLLKEASDAKKNKTPLPDDKQDLVNLLYRTCTQDWFLQGDYRDPESHRQFGRLHEIIHTTGTQRSVQELFQRSATEMLQRLPVMLRDIATHEADISGVFERLQIGVSLAREELFEMVIDEVIWGQTFAKYSKPVGLSTIGAGGADCPMFRMLDAVCGKAGDPMGDTLLAELDMRTRHFPPTIRRLIHKIAAGPSVRSYIASGSAGPRLSQAFSVFQQLLYDLYEMHRKKAMRIVLALRAGQLYTSSGTQNAKSPEWHISNTLSKAMTVRFGSDPATRRIPATATPIHRKSTGRHDTESKIIRLDFDAPMALAAGDGILVTVHSEDFGTQTRTYSITKTYPIPDFGTESDDDLHVTRSVEICCRSAGLVSTFICQRETAFPVSVALSPSPHFRIKANKNKSDEAFFIAQNGGAGVFLGWLSRRDSLVGTYTLVIGAQNLGCFIYTDELLDAMDKFGAHLKVVLCLSKPESRDLELLAGRNCRAFHGRAPAVLQDLHQRRSAPTYVCGSSEFGLSVAEALNRASKHTSLDADRRMAQINTSSMPDLHLHVAAAKPSAATARTLAGRVISRSEMATHNAPGDIWISIGDTVYDISVLSTFHPGGEKTLLCRAGLDAEDMFHSVHQGSFEVLSLLAPMAIGQLESKNTLYADSEKMLDILVQAQNDLTNSSRFEQRPTGSAEQLERAPPAELVRCSLSQFCKVWTALLERCGAPRAAAASEAIETQVGALEQRLAERQTSLYESAFWDEGRCASGLCDIFDAHESAVVEIHGIVDEMKMEAARSRLSAEDWRLLFDTATPKVAAALGNMM
ncbi:cytochrome b5-like Heme/Steroid binding domain-containing protein [Cordyceps javanica]|uniref:Cytochrome b5-like Heme/Steroid binding domain-containing protein n=1 Tax=Cordyceps javanica TaxID=43265 RepID=A0A545VKQ8_9HYPO|nr:cytochrome b5-like Heme/Steroid binding domain-containing protein [Cordyceps javanica]TQW02318.1 cytochrome b5-like Heme/Steroid binding domain-containing protein [Cordyceps javanica]